MGKNKVSPEVRKAINEAVQAGLKAGRTQAEQQCKDAYKATERRLYAYPVLIQKVEDEKLKLKELQQTGAPGTSKDIVRFTRPGVRLTSEEICETLIADCKARIAADELEIETIEKAVSNIEDDVYYPAVKGRFFQGISDDEIACQIHCDVRTVRRNRGRLVRVLAVWLYGSEAV